MQFTRFAVFGALSFSLLLGGVGVVPIRAQQSDTPGPNGYRGPLPRDEFEAAWVRLFDGETTYGWQERSDSGSASGSSTTGGGGDAAKTDGSAAKGWSIDQAALQVKDSATTLATKAEYGDFELAGECWLENQGGATLSLHAPAEGNITAKNAVQFKFMPAGRTAAKPDTFLVAQGKWQPFAVTLEGGKITHLAGQQGEAHRSEGDAGARRDCPDGKRQGHGKIPQPETAPAGFQEPVQRQGPDRLERSFRPPIRVQRDQRRDAQHQKRQRRNTVGKPVQRFCPVTRCVFQWRPFEQRRVFPRASGAVLGGL